MVSALPIGLGSSPKRMTWIRCRLILGGSLSETLMLRCEPIWTSITPPHPPDLDLVEDRSRPLDLMEYHSQPLDLG